MCAPFTDMTDGEAFSFPLMERSGDHASAMDA